MSDKQLLALVNVLQKNDKIPVTDSHSGLAHWAYAVVQKNRDGEVNVCTVYLNEIHTVNKLVMGTHGQMMVSRHSVTIVSKACKTVQEVLEVLNENARHQDEILGELAEHNVWSSMEEAINV